MSLTNYVPEAPPSAPNNARQPNGAGGRGTLLKLGALFLGAYLLDKREKDAKETAPKRARYLRGPATW